MKNKKILVIEDNLEVRENLVEILDLSGYDVVEAKNGVVGVQQARSTQPDLIICDVMMPELDGFGVLKILNNDPALNHIPFLFLTAKAEKSDFRKGMGLGADDYITKPFDDTELLEAIEMRLSKAQSIVQATESTDNLDMFFSEVRATKGFEEFTTNNERREFASKTIIYNEGSKPRWIYFIVSGSVKTYKTNDYGKTLTLNLLEKGDFFGYSEMINSSLYTHSASSLDDTELQLISKDDFFSLLYKNRDFSAQFVKLLVSRNKDQEQLLLDLAYSSVRKKVANALLAFSEVNSETKCITVAREELAAKAGTAKETLIRTLSDFKSEGLISVEDKSIKINSVEGLTGILS